MTSVLVWNIGVASNRTAIHAPRIKTIADIIYIQNPDICVLMDAFQLNTDQYSIAKLLNTDPCIYLPLAKVR